MWIVCSANDSHEMSSFFFSKKKQQQQKKQHCFRRQSAESAHSMISVKDKQIKYNITALICIWMIIYQSQRLRTISVFKC